MNSEENKETLMQQEPSVPEEDQNPQLSQENVEGTQPPQPTDLADEQSAQPPLIKGEKKKTVFREIVSWVMTIVIAVALALFIRTFIFEPVRVDGSSMNYTLLDNEYMIVTKYDYWLGEPERFDVVICHYPGRDRTNFVKRLVGLPGDTVSMLNGTLYVNGESIDEPYITNHANYNMEAVTLGENEYFVLGDNRSSSNDSHIIGPLSRDQIKGHVRLVVFPFSQFRVIE
ncbi:MAG TPA: signal peptidase I [Candidatus Aphodomonas merdavium]|nr:signal peptidase I [Candidatus Aphodomonas merdavium]